jgi:hypothetical protein
METQCVSCDVGIHLSLFVDKKLVLQRNIIRTFWLAKIQGNASVLETILKVCYNLNNVIISNMSQESAVGIAIGYRLEDQGVGVLIAVGSRIFSTSSRPVLGPTQPPIKWLSWALSLGVKRPGRETDHSPPVSAEVKKTWIYTSIPTYAFMA